MNNIQAQIDYFNHNSATISKEHLGKVIIIGPDMTVNDYQSLTEAYNAGVKVFGYGNFLMKDLTKGSGAVVNMINPSITTTL